MAAARAPAPSATTRRRPGACRRSATAPARRASSPIATSSAAAAVARGEAVADESLFEEGAVGRGAPDVAHRVHERLELPHDGPHLVADVDDLPRDGRPHDRRSRRAQARARVRVRGDGRPQARRVRADAHLPRPRWQGQGAMSPENPQDPQKGKPQEDVQASQEAVESADAVSQEKAAIQAASSPGTGEKAGAPAPKKPRSRARAAKAKEPEA